MAEAGKMIVEKIVSQASEQIYYTFFANLVNTSQFVTAQKILLKNMSSKKHIEAVEFSKLTDEVSIFVYNECANKEASLINDLFEHPMFIERLIKDLNAKNASA